jgi:hypothetical protein
MVINLGAKYLFFMLVGFFNIKVTHFFLAFSGTFAQKSLMEAKEGSCHLNYTSYTL